MTELFITHCKNLIGNNQDCWFEQLAWKSRMTINSLIEIDPLCPKLIHILSQFTNFLKVMSLARSLRICDIKEGKGVLLKATF